MSICKVQRLILTIYKQWNYLSIEEINVVHTHANLVSGEGKIAHKEALGYKHLGKDDSQY